MQVFNYSLHRYIANRAQENVYVSTFMQFNSRATSIISLSIFIQSYLEILYLILSLCRGLFIVRV